MKLNYKRILKYGTMPFLAVLVLLFTLLNGGNSAWVEKYYSNGLYPVFSKFLSWISSVIPFSISDLFYLVLGAILIFFIVQVFRKKGKRLTYGLRILNLLAAVYVFFYLFWGFNYFRPNVYNRIGLEQHTVDTVQFKQVFEEFIAETNELQHESDSLDKSQVDALIEQSYAELFQNLNLKAPVGSREDKGITFSGFYASSGISGYYGPFFNEVHVNKKLLAIEYPYTLAHEKAHQLGVTSEAEANFYAWMACHGSESAWVRYSGNLSVLPYFLHEASSLKSYRALVAQISQPVKDDYNAIRRHWQTLLNAKMDQAASKVNDTYLKANKVEDGVQNYSGVLKMVLDYQLQFTALSDTTGKVVPE